MRDPVLRQVHDWSHRIVEQWWCLYGDGRRGQCWFFAPDPPRTGNKLLAPLLIEDVLAPKPDQLILRTCGSMTWTRRKTAPPATISSASRVA